MRQNDAAANTDCCPEYATPTAIIIRLCIERVSCEPPLNKPVMISLTGRAYIRKVPFVQQVQLRIS